MGTIPICPGGEMVDTGDLKSSARKGVPVRIRLRVPFYFKLKLGKKCQN